MFPKGEHRAVWAQWASENIDTSNQVSVYIALDALAQHPEYLTLENGRTIAHELSLWDARA